MTRLTRSTWSAGCDLLGEEYDTLTLPLPDDYEGPVVLNVVRYRPSVRRGNDAVLWVHGFADYFFQHHVAQHFANAGYSFYAVDLRRYGRSLLPHQTPAFCLDVAEHFEDLDAALRILTELEGHSDTTVIAHSMGGLITALWRRQLDAARARWVPRLILNSPFFALPDLAPGVASRLKTSVITTLGRLSPYREIPRRGERPYGRSLHGEAFGAWDYDLKLKPHDSFPIRAGWLATMLTAQRSLVAGGFTTPTLVLTSARWARLAADSPQAREVDLVLDVARIRSVAKFLGTAATHVTIDGAAHDVTLSEPPVLDLVFDEIDRWLKIQGG